MRVVKRILPIFLLFMVVLGAFTFASTTAEAAAHSFVLPYNEPQLSGDNGYLVFEDNVGLCHGLYWNLQPTEPAAKTGVIIELNQDHITLSPNAYYNVFTVLYFDEYGDVSLVHSGHPSEFTLNINGIQAVSFYGNYADVVDYANGGTWASVEVVWSETSNVINELSLIYLELLVLNNELDGQLDSIISQLSDVKVNTDTLVGYLDRIELLLEAEFPLIRSQLDDIYDLLEDKVAIQIEKQEEANELQKEQNTTTTNIFTSISDFFGSFFENFINMVKSLFVPEEDYFQTKFDEFYDFLTEKLGVLLYPFELMRRLLDAFNNIAVGTGILSLPEVKIFDAVLIPATDFDLAGMFEEVLGEYYDVYYAFVDVLILCLFIGYLIKTYNRIVR